MATESDLRRRVNQQLRAQFSEIQTHHHEQLALLDKLQDQIGKVRSSLITSQLAELNAFREMNRRLEWMLNDQSPDDGGQAK